MSICCHIIRYYDPYLSLLFRNDGGKLRGPHLSAASFLLLLAGLDLGMVNSVLRLFGVKVTASMFLVDPGLSILESSPRATVQR